MSDFLPAISLESPGGTAWLRSRAWNLKFISLSVVLVAVPYLGYLGLLCLEPLLKPLVGGPLGASTHDVSRNIVNAFAALLIGGPHTVATLSRTALDHDFAKSHRAMVLSSLVIPVIVTVLAFLDISLLLTIFFFWASLHVLHQIFYITELYNRKHNIALTPLSRYADYIVVLTSLYTLAAWRVASGKFLIGPIDVSAKVADLIGIVGLRPGPWMIWLVAGPFCIGLVLWGYKTIRELRLGFLHGPKTLFIGLTVVATFFIPILGNLDTAFQGMNLWHSFQYLALTWMLNNLRAQRGELDNSPFVKRLSENNAARRYYLFNVMLAVANVLLGGVIMVGLYLAGMRGERVFTYGYYIAILSFAWMHYYQDHFLFAQPQVIRP